MQELLVRSTTFSSVLQRWAEMNRSLAQVWDWKDSPWWCGERAAVSLLGSAVWQAGGQALAEYESPKTFGRDRYVGRGDLCFVLDGRHYVAEAKYRCAPIGVRARSAIAGLEADLEEACKDVACIRSSEERGLAIALVAPCVSASEAGRTTDLIGSFQRELLKVDCPHLAWAFPEETTLLRAEDGYVYPGIVLVIREA